MELETSRDALRKEIGQLQRRMAEMESDNIMREKDLQLSLEDARVSQRKLDDQRRSLDMMLENANAECDDLKLRLSGAEGRISALETELARTEGAKKDAEFKLSSIASSLRRTIGLPRSRSAMRSRSPSPRRSRPTSPTKGQGHKSSSSCYSKNIDN